MQVRNHAVLQGWTPEQRWTGAWRLIGVQVRNHTGLQGWTSEQQRWKGAQAHAQVAEKPAWGWRRPVMRGAAAERYWGGPRGLVVWSAAPMRLDCRGGCGGWGRRLRTWGGWQRPTGTAGAAFDPAGVEREQTASTRV